MTASKAPNRGGRETRDEAYSKKGRAPPAAQCLKATDRAIPDSRWRELRQLHTIRAFDRLSLLEDRGIVDSCISGSSQSTTTGTFVWKSSRDTISPLINPHPSFLQIRAPLQPWDAASSPSSQTSIDSAMSRKPARRLQITFRKVNDLTDVFTQ